MTSLPIEGALEIRLGVDGGRFSRVVINNRRLLAATAPLAGRAAGEVPGLVARLFSICRMAQGVAAATAVERALGAPTDPVQAAARGLLVSAETVLEHATRILVDWAQMAGEVPAFDVLKPVRRVLIDLAGDLYPDGDWMAPGGGRLMIGSDGLAARLRSVDQALGRAIFGGAPPLDPAAWAEWLKQGATAAARLVGRLIDDGLAGFGASRLGDLPPFDARELEARLAADADFVARPDCQGQVFLTGPLARLSAHPLVGAVVARHGRGVVAHLAARLVELALTLRKMQDFSHAPSSDNISPSGPSSGLAVVEAARGRLVHRAELHEGKVISYQILAPTEWNFHPAGPLAEGLIGQPAGGDAVARARLLVAALDPCVACAVEVD